MSMPTPKPLQFEVFDQDLDKTWTDLFSQSSSLAIDTEAMGLMHGRDRLCLVQICDSKDNVACIRIAINQNSAPNLKVLLENKSIEKIFHFARFDVAALAHGLGIKVNPIFCTKIASKIGRTYSPKHGLKELILDLVGIELDKRAQSSDWGKVDELTENQLLYAANDTRYLIKAKEYLQQMLIREGRWNIAKKCFLCIPTFSELDRLKYTNIFEH